MRDFLAGNRMFKKDEIVYFVEKKYSQALGWYVNLNFGTIGTYCGHGNYSIDTYDLKETRLINGVPINEYDQTQVYKYPKKWTYNTPLYELTHSDEYNDIHNEMRFCRMDNIEDIKSLIKKGYLVKTFTLFKGDIETKKVSKTEYKVVLKYRRWKSYQSGEAEINQDYIFRDCKEAVECKKNMDELIHKNYDLSDEELSWIDIKKVLSRLNQDDADKCLHLIQDEFSDIIEDIDIRRFDNKIQYMNHRADKKWIDLYELTEEKNIEVHTEHYYYSVRKIYDMDEKIFVKGYTDCRPDTIFEEYGKDPENILCIANKMWNIEDQSNPKKICPARYTNKYMKYKDVNNINEDPYNILCAEYILPHGTFTIGVDDNEIKHYSFTFGNYYLFGLGNNYNAKFIGNIKNNKFEEKVKEKLLKELKKTTGDFYKLFERILNE